MKLNRVVAFGVLIASIISSIAIGLPRFSGKAEQKCNLCHVSPTGGGMRNSFGSQFFALTELAMHKSPMDSLAKFHVQISDMISVGADMRTQFYYDEPAEQSSFFQMEGNLYVNAQLNKLFSLTVGKGLYTGFEIYGMGYMLPMKGYFRVGKFQPAYGWRFADHTSFVREKMLWPAGSTDTGFELGIYPHGFSANVGFFNGTGGTFDTDNGKAISSRVEYRRNIKGVGIGIGGSYWLNSTDPGNVAMFGPFGYINMFKGRLLYLGEIDWVEDKTLSTEPVSEATTHKLSYMLKQGIWLKTSYDFFDPDIDFKSGRISRYGIGIEYFPYGFLEIQPNIWLYQDDLADDDKYLFFNTQMHFFF